MRVVLTHIKNEAYMMKWWLMHHRDKFDHGIIVDYDSSDNIYELVKELVPTWEIRQSRNKNFDPIEVDREIFDIEGEVQKRYPRAWMLTLTVSEFLIGDTTNLPYKTTDICLPVRCDVMVDTLDTMHKEPDPNISLVRQRTTGIPSPFNEQYRNEWRVPHADIWCRLMRGMHNHNYNYMEHMGPGRHTWNPYPTNDFRILWYGFSPYTERLINRKLVIWKEMPEEAQLKGIGAHHNTTRHQILWRLGQHQEYTLELRDIIAQFEPQLWDFAPQKTDILNHET